MYRWCSNFQSPGQKNLLLLLAGAGILGAMLLIAVGIYFLISSDSGQVAADTPTSTPTIKPVAETPTTSAGVGITIVAPPTPTGTVMPLDQGGDTLTSIPTITRAPTSTPTPRPAAPQPSPKIIITIDGTIELLAPTNDIQIDGESVEFRWKWHENKGCLQPPEGFAFEIRVWRDDNVSPPMGAMDAKIEKQGINCDPNTGIRTFTIGKIRDVPGARDSKEGRFRWDVVLVQLEPYQPIIIPQYRTFFY